MRATARRLLPAVLAVAVAAAPVGTRLPHLPPSLQSRPAYALTDEQRLIADTWRIVDGAYIDRTFNGNDWFGLRQRYLRRQYTSREEAYDALREMLAKLGDPYTRFLTPDQYRSVSSAAEGELFGVGVELFPTRARADGTKDDAGALRVLATIDGSPAARAGILARDEILAIDGEDASELTPDTAAARIRGGDGTSVELTVRHAATGAGARATGRAAGGAGSADGAGAGGERVAMRREHVRLVSVSHRMLDRRTGYVRIRQFSTSTADELRDALADLQRSAGAPTLQRLVVDLRDNPGGYFLGGVDTARLFLPADATIVYVANRDGVEDSRATDADGLLADRARTSVVVLINRSTASASEILAGALQDNRRGALVGERSFGKGIVQTVSELRDGSAIAVTVSRYETPAHRDINKRGIEPDVAAPACAAATATQVIDCVPTSAWQ